MRETALSPDLAPDLKNHETAVTLNSHQALNAAIQTAQASEVDQKFIAAALSIKELAAINEN
ncbi:MAG: hypothetical protein COB54_01980 [Alphaproteobacteria bacterium]|nr:MAG: hypothetical protein COB54_01980 [Alphaproteobacteria bacterium]